MPNVVFIHRGGPSMASYRYRCEIPGAELEKHGHTVTFNQGDAHIAIFTKPTLDDLALARIVKARDCIIIADLGDDHFDHPELGHIYREMVEIAHQTVAPTAVMAEKHKKYTDIEPVVIPDPYEIERMAPHVQGHEMMWFGGNWNLKDIHPYLERMPHLTVVTGPKVHELTNWIKWSPESQAEALANHDIVLFPHRKGTEYKTANRLINTIQSGCFPVCDFHPSYEEFKEFVWVSGVPTGLRWIQENGAMLNDNLSKAQDYVEAHYSPAVIGNLWNNMISSFISDAAPSPAQDTGGLDTEITTAKSI